MSRKLILFGEGAGDRGSLPILTSKILTRLRCQDALSVSREFFEVGNIHSLLQVDRKTDQIVATKWLNLLRAAGKQRPYGILVVLDGDVRFPPQSPDAFCAATAARKLADIARREAGAGQVFSLGVVFACKEYESWLVAGIESLAGKRLPNGQVGVRAGTELGRADPQTRGEKWLAQQLTQSYKKTEHQAALTRHLDIEQVVGRKVRSFERLIHAVQQLAEAARSGGYVCSPS